MNWMQATPFFRPKLLDCLHGYNRERFSQDVGAGLTVGVVALPLAMAFAIAKDTSGLTDAAARLKLEGEVMKVVDSQLGAVARPSRVFFVSALPKTRSGKLLRRAIQAVAEGRDPGDLTTMDDPAALQQIVDQIKG